MSSANTRKLNVLHVLLKFKFNVFTYLSFAFLWQDLAMKLNIASKSQSSCLILPSDGIIKYEPPCLAYMSLNITQLQFLKCVIIVIYIWNQFSHSKVKSLKWFYCLLLSHLYRQTWIHHTGKTQRHTLHVLISYQTIDSKPSLYIGMCWWQRKKVKL